MQSAKKHLSSLLSSEALDVDTFATVLVEVEGILNRRPLTYQSTDSRDPDVLTPSDFLYPGVVSHSSVKVLPPSPPGDGEVLRYSWRNARHLIDKFWKWWSREYVTLLQSRAKWRGTVPDLRVGQVVLLVDENVVRDQWRLGVIESVGGGENHVRTAEVRLANGKKFVRHCTKLVGLEMDSVNNGDGVHKGGMRI